MIAFYCGLLDVWVSLDANKIPINTKIDACEMAAQSLSEQHFLTKVGKPQATRHKGYDPYAN